ncbi:hypothetical protein [Vibrio rhizosphaerae]|uniref:Uncharacterized protein n=1 Tax=Vibrio rhizosphaerae TaxID=398736 RepID=A0ABU4J036_9VIBR|nr:hypothetical protein [Vibrio rhizosphaerae]MDW6094737.1 hypothetical protein [Vibrio rhizosphaerae]
MIKIFKYIFFVFIFIVLGTVIYAVSVIDVEQDTPRAEIIDEIFWHNGLDGRTGFKIISSEPPIYNIRVYYNLDDVYVDTKSKYIGKNFKKLDVTSIIAFDGNAFFLKNNDHLKVINTLINSND